MRRAYVGMPYPIGDLEKSRSCKGGKKSKHRLTIACFVSASGKKEKPVVIWKSENPRCL